MNRGGFNCLNLKKTVIAVAVLILLTAAPASADDKNILLIDSFDADELWIEDLSTAADDYFGMHPGYTLYSETADVSSGDSESSSSALYNFIREKYKDKRIDAVITVNQYAADFEDKYHDELFAGIPVVNAGIYSYSLDNSSKTWKTGLHGGNEIFYTLDFICRYSPGKEKKIYIIMDDSSSGDLTIDSIVRYVRVNHPDFKTEIISFASEAELEAKIGSVPQGEPVFLINIPYDKRIFISENEILSLLKKCRGNVFAVNSEWIKSDAVDAGYAMSPYNHGLKAAETAYSILQGVPASEIPVIDDSVQILSVKYAFMHDKSKLPAGTVILNEPVSTVEIQLEMIVLLLTVILISSVVINILVRLRRIAEKTGRETEERNRMLNLAYAAVNLGNWEIDLKNGTEYISPEVYEMMGIPESERSKYPKFVTFEKLICPGDLAEFRKILPSETEKVLHVSAEFRVKDGYDRWKGLMFKGAVVELDILGNPVHASGILYDISEELSMRKNLERITKKEDLFLSVILTGIELGIRNIKKDLSVLIFSASRNDSRIGIYSKKMDALCSSIDDTISFARVYKSMMEEDRKWLSLREMTLGALARLPENTYNIDIKTKDAWIYTDSFFGTLIEILLMTIINLDNGASNAGLAFEPLPSGRAVISIWDDGEGFTDEEKKTLFSWKEDKNNRHDLFICREIAEIMGFTITETGRKDMGVLFEISIPQEFWRITKANSAPEGILTEDIS